MKSTRQVRSVTMYGVVMALALLGIAGTAAACYVRSPGYWKNHPEAWPVCRITIGRVTYDKDTAIDIMQTPVQGNKSYTLFNALVSAKLNVAAGNVSTCILGTIQAADGWFYYWKCWPGSGVEIAGSSQAWKCAEELYLLLDAYNNGLLCAPAED